MRIKIGEQGSVMELREALELFKGFINGATAFELIRLERYEAAKRVWQTHEKYLSLLQEGIEEHALFLHANGLLYALRDRYGTILKTPEK